MNVATLKAILILPGTVLVYVPALLLWSTRNTAHAASVPTELALPVLAGIGFALAGLTLMVWTVRLFVARGGGGSPAPWRPIKNFIVQGPYRHVRNPMIIGVSFVSLSEAILLASYPILAWTVFFVVANTIYFKYSEEPRLEQRFGKPYADYRRAVPRWIPRLRPYDVEGKE